MKQVDKPEPLPDPAEEARWQRRLIRGIIYAVLVWGLLLAIGAMIFQNAWDLRKLIIVFGFVAAFLLFWAAMLGVRQRRLDREKKG